MHLSEFGLRGSNALLIKLQAPNMQAPRDEECPKWSAGVHMSDDEDDVIGADLAALMDSAAAVRCAPAELPEGPASCSGHHHSAPSTSNPVRHQVKTLQQDFRVPCVLPYKLNNVIA